MNTCFDLSKVDFRTTPIENIFLDTYLGQADGDAIKVYLYGWKHCCGREAVSFDYAEAAEALALSESGVADAVAYWMDEGLIELVLDGDEERFVFKSVLLHWAGIYDDKAEPVGSTTSTAAVEGRLQAATPVRPENARAREKLFRGLEAFLSEGLSYEVALRDNEIRRVHEMLDAYPIDEDFFLYAYRKATLSSEASSRSFQYVTAIVENWIRFDHVTTSAGLDALVEQQKSQKAQTKRDRRRAKRPQAERAREDNRMSDEERRAFIRQKLGRRGVLRGDGDEA